jgi:hypothetical protein
VRRAKILGLLTLAAVGLGAGFALASVVSLGSAVRDTRSIATYIATNAEPIFPTGDVTVTSKVPKRKACQKLSTGSYQCQFSETASRPSVKVVCKNSVKLAFASNQQISAVAFPTRPRCKG